MSATDLSAAELSAAELSAAELSAPDWRPIAAIDDLVPRHVFQASLHGQELAVWRADSGELNAWENRCLHRGVRLSIGFNNGAELLCRYHGWRYATGSAGCTYIPAHPADAPARTITNRTHPVAERYGLVWSGRDATGEPPVIDELEAEAFVLRALPVRAPAAVVERALADHRFAPCDDLDAGPEAIEMSADRRGSAMRLTTSTTGGTSTVVFLVQPLDEATSVIRPVLAEVPIDALAVLHHHGQRLRELVDRIEALAPPSAAIRNELLETPVIIERAGVAGLDLRVRVRRKWPTTTEVTAFEFEAVDSVLPTFQPGAHIDVELPNGLVRQYSLTNGPGESDCYRIGVKLEPDGGGGSTLLHDVVAEGDLLTISPPRNGFPLRRDTNHTVLIAGGIGITPLLAMARAIRHDRRGLEFHAFVRTADALAFADVVESFGEAVSLHVGLSPEETAERLRRILDDAHTTNPDALIYACGPGPMLDTVRATAGTVGWDAGAVHVEHFSNDRVIDDSAPFEVDLARSATTLTVPGGTSLLDVLRAEGVGLPSSCEKGACGTCAVPVIDGVPDHNDVYLNDAERAANTTMMSCVSRAVGERLVLDL